jgi:hypothetical protein
MNIFIQKAYIPCLGLGLHKTEFYVKALKLKLELSAEVNANFFSSFLFAHCFYLDGRSCAYCTYSFSFDQHVLFQNKKKLTQL